MTGATDTTSPAIIPATFADLGVLAETVEALDSLGITSPFPIQSATIPVALGGSDVIGQAKTGTGKTLAFGIPILQRVTGLRADGAVLESADPAESAAGIETATGTAAAPETAPAKSARGRGRGRGRSSGAPANGLAPAHGAPQALIVVPTRELAVQVASDLLAAGKVRAVRVHALYGGRAYEPQVAALRAGIDVAVGTPGRLLDLAQQKHLDLSRVRTLVLDEADEMLDLGFLPDVERIIDQLPAERQTMLFSATMPGQVISLARRYMTKPTHIRAADPDDHGTQVMNIAQFVYRAHSLDKIELLSRVLQADGRGLAMVFARTKRTVAKVADELAARHFAVAAVHGDLGQGAREQALRAFRNGKVDVLVATDVAARGIDVEGVTHVVNFQCPEDEKVYTHRIGRTGRAGAKGTAVTLVDWDEVPKWQLINKGLDLQHPDPPEVYSTSPQLFSDLGIPTTSKGVLPRVERTREGLAAETLEDVGETGRGRGPKVGGGRGGAPARGGSSQGGSRSGAPSGAQPDSHDAAEPRSERPPRTPRQRTRSRGGVAVDGVVTQTSAQTGTQAATAPAAVEQVAQAAPAALEPTAPARPKRVRTRSAKPEQAAKPEPTLKAQSFKLESGSLASPMFRSAAPDKPVVQPAVPAAPIDTVVFTPVAETVATAEPAAARKRTRSRKKAEPAGTALVDAVIPAQPVAHEAPVLETVEAALAEVGSGEPAAPKKAPRRRPAKKAVPAESAHADQVSASVTESPASAEVPAPVANPRRTKV